MIRTVAALALFALAAVVGHWTVISAAPGFIMTTAMGRLEEQGLPLHAFVLAPRATPQNQVIVRPSPDLAYSLCRFDLSDGPVLIEGEVWTAYASLSVYDAKTDNVFATSLDSARDEPRAVIVAMQGQSAGDRAGERAIVRLTSPQGLALIRRLAPSDALYARAAIAAEGDRCSPL